MRILNKIILIFIVMMLIVVASCKEDKQFSLKPNTSLTFGFVDTLELLSRLPKEYIWPNKEGYLDSLAYCYNNQELLYDKYAFAVTNLNKDGEFLPPYYYVNLGGTEVERIAQMSVNGKEWILDWPTGIQDTLYLEYYIDNEGPNNCNCREPYSTILLNGKPYKEIINPTGNGIFLF